MSRLSKKTKDALIRKAIERNGLEISPTRPRKTVHSDFNFTVTDLYNGKTVAIFWYNTPDHSTHVVEMEI